MYFIIQIVVNVPKLSNQTTLKQAAINLINFWGETLTEVL